MASPSSWTCAPALRTSVSYGNIRPSSSTGTTVGKGTATAAATGTGHGLPRGTRRERGKLSIAHHDTSASSSTLTSSSSAGALQDSTVPSSPITSTRFEGDYLAAKRRTHRQSYFDHYPERGGPRIRGDGENGNKVGREKETKERDTEKEIAYTAQHSRIYDDQHGTEDNSCETFGRSTIRKSLSVDASDLSSTSTSTTVLGVSRKGKERDWLFKEGERLDQEASIAFPQICTTRTANHPKSSSSSIARTLSAPKTHSHSHPYGCFRDDVPALRFSYSTYSSSQTQADTPTPPQTPIEANSRASLDPVHVVVAAPISGVEAMDALVDGMEGSDEDELFNRLQIHTSKQATLSHHPLYAPPLPTPPPGIVLGGPSLRKFPRKESISSENEEDEENEDEVHDQSTVLGRAARTNTERRHGYRRTGSSGTVVSDMTDRRQQSSAVSTSEEINPVPTPAPPPSIDEIIRRHAVTSGQPHTRPKVVVPSISDIIRRNTPVKQVQNDLSSRASSAPGHGTRHEVSEPEPEPLTPSEEAELMARSSIDSIAAEVRQTLRSQLNPTATSMYTASSTTAHAQDDLSGISNYNASRSAGRCDQSIRSDSASLSASLSASTSNGTGGGRASTGPHGSPSFVHDPGLNFRALRTGGGQKKQSSQKDAIATYLRSARITTLLKLTRRPHASPDRPLTVSVSDLGSPTGFPLLVFLGLGCVRFVMGLYDEMAECLGLRLITIDRWGLGRTDVPPSSASRGVPEWSTVVDEVLDRLNIDRCSIMAHSAGAPYALSFASKYPERVVGDICLLAPWVGGSAGGGYRWLKYVPNGILKTAQAADWKIQAWMIGKPPKITYEGIGYNVKAPVSSDSCKVDSRGSNSDEQREPDEFGAFSAFSANDGDTTTPSHTYPYTLSRVFPPRKSMSSEDTFSDYDDLEDFGGRFESRTTLEQTRRRSTISAANGPSISLQQQQQAGRVTKKKTSRGFLRIWKGIPGNNNVHAPPLPSIESTLQQSQQQSQEQSTQPLKSQGRKLKTLKSIGSLRNKSVAHTLPHRPQTVDKSPVLPQQDFDTSLTLGLEELSVSPKSGASIRPHLELDTNATFPRRSTYSADGPDVKNVNVSTSPAPTGPYHAMNGRAGGRRSVSFTSYSVLSRPSSYSANSHVYSGHSSTPPASEMSHEPFAYSATSTNVSAKKSGDSYEIALGNALIAASHAESARGTHPDLLQILNHEQRPWGFSYARYPHRVRVWFGDRDERIASHAVRWMENAMGTERCKVIVVHGADHGLMYRTSVVVDVLEHVLSLWQDGGWRLRERADNYELGTDPFRSQCT